jgi:hypothetical protein
MGSASEIRLSKSSEMFSLDSDFTASGSVNPSDIRIENISNKFAARSNTSEVFLRLLESRGPRL